jgi:hypothetical protein
VTDSDWVCLALGLALGAATGAALVMVLLQRPPRREIRVTVARDAVPRRATTLSADAFVTSPSEPARGGPADRRSVDRAVESPAWGIQFGVRLPDVGRAVAPPDGTATAFRQSLQIRTPVPSPDSAVAIAIRPGADLEAQAEPEADGVLAGKPAGPVLLRMLAGDHGAMVEILDVIAPPASAARRDWQVLLAGLASELAETAIERGVLAFPMGNPFWDALTVDQCRQVAGVLASMGFRFDGRSGWADRRGPSYRDLGQALAACGIDPRRIRAWPNSEDLANLWHGARAAPEDLVAEEAPDLDAGALVGLLGARADRLAGLWLAWDSVRTLLLSDRGGAGGEPAA